MGRSEFVAMHATPLHGFAVVSRYVVHFAWALDYCMVADLQASSFICCQVLYTSMLLGARNRCAAQSAVELRRLHNCSRLIGWAGWGALIQAPLRYGDSAHVMCRTYLKLWQPCRARIARWCGVIWPDGSILQQTEETTVRAKRMRERERRGE